MNPSLLPAALSFSLYLSIHLYLALHCSNSRLPLFKHPARLFFPFFFLLLAHSVHRHFVSSFPRLFKHSSGEFQSTQALIAPLCCKKIHSISSTGSKINFLFFLIVQKKSHPCTRFLGCYAWYTAAVCFQLIHFGM